MQYLITYTDLRFYPFYTKWYEYENHFSEDSGMVVFDLINHLYTTNGKDWQSIPEDHL